jgi:hypothetical protein
MTQEAPQDAPQNAAADARRRADEKLDDALEATFPASDPLALMLDEDPNSRVTYASPPCFMHELDPSYLGLAPDPERPADHDEPDATTPKDADSK